MMCRPFFVFVLDYALQEVVSGLGLKLAILRVGQDVTLTNLIHQFKRKHRIPKQQNFRLFVIRLLSGFPRTHVMLWEVGPTTSDASYESVPALGLPVFYGVSLFFRRQL